MDNSNPKVKEMVEKLVQDILAGEASASASSKLEKVLGESSATISELKGKVVDLEKAAVDNIAVLEDLEKVKTELETEVTALNGQVEVLNVEKAALEERASKAEGVLADMEKDQGADSRMAELAEVKVVRVNEEAASAQRLQVRDMSDEEFAAYRDERVALKEELLAVIAQETAAEKAEVKVVKEPEVIEGSKAAGEEGVVEVGITPPADIDGALENASAVMPNTPSEKKEKGWKEFGTVLADIVKNQRGDSKTKGQ